MTGWKEIPFRKLLIDEVISYGIVQPGQHQEQNSVPIIRVNNFHKRRLNTSEVLKVSKDIEKNYSRTRLEGGELLITVVGSIGQCAIAPASLRGWNVARAVAVARINDEFDKYFIMSQFESEDIQFQMYGNTNDTVQPTLNLSSLKELKFRIPSSKHEQKAIAAVLSSLDDKIDLLHRQNATLEAMAEALFRQWFVVEAKEEWEEGALGDYVTISYGKNLPTKNLLQSGYPVFGANGQIGYCERYMYEEQQVLVSCRGEASGKVNVSWKNSFITNNSLVLERNKNPDVTFSFLKYYALSYDFGVHVSGSAQPQITIDGLYNAAFLLPDKKTIFEFSSIADSLEAKQEQNQTQIHTLEKLRDTLLPKLMSGEVRVQC